jgi:ABC-type uncharacterized transport system substrate-binding protein
VIEYCASNLATFPLQSVDEGTHEAARVHGTDRRRNRRAAPVHAKDEIEGVIAAQARDPGGGLIVMPDSFNVGNPELIVALAARYGIPAIYYHRLFPELGGLIAYGANFAEQFHPAAGYIDRIFRGTNPADLPIQAPTKFELVINLTTAKALGLTVPEALLVAADEVIE